jgi:hypothetical protein
VSGDAAFWAHLVIAILATWRLTHLLVREDGPASLVVRLRTLAGTSWLGHSMDCFNCTSLWVAAPMAWWIGTGIGEIFMLWVALSGAVCLLERAGADRLVVQPLNMDAQGDSHGMLRTESSGVEQSAAGQRRLDADAIRCAGPIAVCEPPADVDLAHERRG